MTAAHNESATIGATIRGVLSQSVTPLRWVIVDDGSDDGTAEVACQAAASASWIEVCRVERAPGRSYLHKLAALRHAYSALRGVDAPFVGNLDADVVVPPHYYERVLAEFAADERLGIAGGVIIEVSDGATVRQRTHPTSVAGGVQLFRRSVWDAIGGYPALASGGEDAIAEVLTREAGFDVRALDGLEVLHDGPVLGGARSRLAARAARGRLDWQLGYHPLFFLARTIARLSERPVLIGSAAAMTAYVAAAARRVPRTPTPRAIELLRQEQLRRLRSAMVGTA